MEEKFEEKNQEDQFVAHKVNAGNTYKVYKRFVSGYTFYNITVIQTTVDGQKERVNISVRFGRDVEIADGTQIKIKKAYENFYYAKDDLKHYNPRLQYYIQDYEIVSDPDKLAVEYSESANEDLDLPF